MVVTRGSVMAGAEPGTKTALGSGYPLRIGSGRRDCLFESKGCKVADGAVMETARVLVAADKFKGSLTAVQVAERVTAGLRRVVPDVRVETLPVADGGDGTVAAAVAAGFERREARVTGPLGDPVTAAYALRDTTAVVEMAEASGLQHLPAGVFAPLTATTYGSGELLAAALDAGARTIVFGVGGSATTDGGAGMLAALGARFLDADGKPVGPGGGGLADLAEADLSGLDPRLADVDLILASDVDNPLTGPKGAPEVYGRQKGATEQDIATLDAALAHYASVLGPDHAGLPGAGAAAWHRLRGAGRARRPVPPRHRGHARRPRLRPGAGARHPGDHRGGFARRADPPRQGPGGSGGGSPRRGDRGRGGLRPPGPAAGGPDSGGHPPRVRPRGPGTGPRGLHGPGGTAAGTGVRGDRARLPAVAGHPEIGIEPVRR